MVTKCSRPTDNSWICNENSLEVIMSLQFNLSGTEQHKYTIYSFESDKSYAPVGVC